MQPAILETAIYCDDLATARHFYEERLGLEVIDAVQNRHVFFRLRDSVLLVFNPVETLKVSAASLAIPTHGATGQGHACFSTAPEGYDYWLRKMNDLGIDVEQEVTWPGGARSFYFRDPSGNSLEFGEPKLWDY